VQVHAAVKETMWRDGGGIAAGKVMERDSRPAVRQFGVGARRRGRFVVGKREVKRVGGYVGG